MLGTKSIYLDPVTVQLKPNKKENNMNYSLMDMSDYYMPMFDVNVLNINKIIYIILFYSVDCPLSIVVSFIIFFIILSSNALFLSVPMPPNADCEYLKKFS